MTSVPCELSFLFNIFILTSEDVWQVKVSTRDQKMVQKYQVGPQT